MLLVILGAGASHDSVLEPPPLAREFRPPLADGLFGHAEYMQRAFERFENLGGMAAEVEMAVKAKVGLESVMDRYRDKATAGHWAAASRVWRQLVEMRYYLFAVIQRSAGEWWNRNGRRTHLELLCTAIDRQLEASEEALFVTFNYDDLLERALKPLGQTYDTLDGYVSGQFPLSGVVCSEQVVVFAYDDDFHFGVLTSSFHWWWVIQHASTLESRIRYTPSDVFETFAQPPANDAVAAMGAVLHAHRRELMVGANEGLTKTYNRVHNPDEGTEAIVRLRQLHIALDEAVAVAYGWTDIAYAHSHYETQVGVRYTISPDARREVLTRLLALNHERYAREAAEGLHAPGRGRGRPRHWGSRETQLTLGQDA